MPSVSPAPAMMPPHKTRPRDRRVVRSRDATRPRPASRWRAAQIAAQIAALIAAAALLVVAGCAAPPSVRPLLELAAAEAEAEAARLDGDAARDAAWVEQSRRVLEDAYHADLAAADGPLDPAWVVDATGPYVAAREALVRHELQLAAEREARADNLRAAADATRRAVDLLDAQRGLLPDPRLDPWRWLNRDRRNEP